jgi:predicted  nucleic acid-binding Zn-ribbon protein
MEGGSTAATFAIRCPKCGKFIHTTAETGVETCARCGWTFKWECQNPEPQQVQSATYQDDWRNPASSHETKEAGESRAHGERTKAPNWAAINRITPAKNASAQGHGIEINWATVYKVGFWIVFVPVFLGCWIYCVAAYGFIIGVLVGWLPSAVVAALAGALWPLLLLAIVLIWFALK